MSVCVHVRVVVRVRACLRACVCELQEESVCVLGGQQGREKQSLTLLLSVSPLVETM